MTVLKKASAATGTLLVLASAGCHYTTSASSRCAALVSGEHIHEAKHWCDR